MLERLAAAQQLALPTEDSPSADPAEPAAARASLAGLGQAASKRRKSGQQRRKKRASRRARAAALGLGRGVAPEPEPAPELEPTPELEVEVPAPAAEPEVWLGPVARWPVAAHALTPKRMAHFSEVRVQRGRECCLCGMWGWRYGAREKCVGSR